MLNPFRFPYPLTAIRRTHVLTLEPIPQCRSVVIHTKKQTTNYVPRAAGLQTNKKKQKHNTLNKGAWPPAPPVTLPRRRY
uniref:Uncharacterized protein n=1 Tax=Romanomermis culicivorax TaxID=13658 RepID=A0A915I6U4_ROMCU